MTSMEGMIESALKFLEEADMPQEFIPQAFHVSQGMVLLESSQLGILIKAEVGTGILLRHDKWTGKWSAPLAIGLTGVGAGLAMGAETRHMVFLLNGDQITKAMASDFSLSIGFNQSWSIGKYGEGFTADAQVGNKGVGVSSAYSQNKGLFYGSALETCAMMPRTHINTTFYGVEMTPKEIVFGKVEDIAPKSEAVKKLHAKLNKLTEEARHLQLRGAEHQHIPE